VNGNLLRYVQEFLLLPIGVDQLEKNAQIFKITRSKLVLEKLKAYFQPAEKSDEIRDNA